MNIQDILTRAKDLRIAIIGDLIEDIYIIGNVTRISPEAPIQIVNVTEHRRNWGGAGNVYHNLRGLGCEVSFFHNEKHIPKKTRIMSGNHHLLRVDEEDTPQWQTWDDIDIGLGYGIENQKFNCVVISDYGKGMVSKEVAKTVIELCNQHEIPVVVDSKQHLEMFAGANVVKCNHKEWNNQDMPFPECPQPWMEENSIDNLVVTQGGQGIRYYGVYASSELSGIIPAHPVAICDTCGAGDTVTAVLGIMAALGEPIDAACELANIAAAEVCKYPGVKPIDKKLLQQAYGGILQ